jgi:hypothetical protein
MSATNEVVKIRRRRPVPKVIERDDEDVLLCDLIVPKPKLAVAVVVPPNKSELRAWCRAKYGKDWWNSPDKKARLAEAKRAISKAV